MLFILVTLIAWGLWGILDKKALEQSTSSNLIIMRYALQVVQIPILICILNVVSPNWHLSGPLVLWSGLAACGYALSSFSYLSAMSKTQASYVLGVTACYPVIATILAAIFLKEVVITSRLLGTAIACLGIIVMSMRSLTEVKSVKTNISKIIALYLVTATFGWAICGIIDKKAVAISGPLEVYLSICIWSVVILPIIFYVQKTRGEHIDISNRKSVLFCTLSVTCSAIGVWSYLSGLGIYPASYVISITACYPVLMYFLAIVFLKERFNHLRFIGITLIVVGAIVIQSAPSIGTTVPKPKLVSNPY